MHSIKKLILFSFFCKFFDHKIGIRKMRRRVQVTFVNITILYLMHIFKNYYLSLNMYCKICLEQIMNKPTIQFCKNVTCLIRTPVNSGHKEFKSKQLFDLDRFSFHLKYENEKYFIYPEMYVLLFVLFCIEMECVSLQKQNIV